MLFSILSSFTDGFAAVLAKFNIGIKGTDGRVFTTFLFLFMALCAAPLLLFLDIKPAFFSVGPLIAISLIILGSALQNVLFYTALKKKDVAALEPLRNSEPVLTILIALLIFPAERNVQVLVLAVIATAALILSQITWDRLSRKIVLDKYVYLFFSSILILAFLNIGYEYILEYISPLTLFSFRAIGVALLLGVIFRPLKDSAERSQLMFYFFLAALYSLTAIFKYLAIVKIGIGLTVLTLMLSPALVYFLSAAWLKEKVEWRKIFASGIIVLCVALAALLR